MSWSGEESLTNHLVNDNLVNDLVDLINTARVTPRQLYTILIDYNLFLLASQMREIRDQIVTYSERNRYEHVLCSRVLDRWNLREAFGVEGYYYYSEEYANTHHHPKDGFEVIIMSFISGE